MALSTLSPAEDRINVPPILSSSDDDILTLDRLPETQTEADHIEEVLTNELNKLTLEDMDKVLFDIHGIPQVSDEDPDNVEDLILDLVRELGKVKVKAAFEEANYMNPDYVTSNEFRLRFLRCERFDPKRAAKKMVKHFEAKRSIFGGGEILGRDITLADLSADDMDTLEAGFLQLLPTRDAAGRVVITLSPGHLRFKSFDNVPRVMWYLVSTVLKEEENQKKGVVMIIYAVRTTAFVSFQRMQRSHFVRDGIPMKLVAIHYCYNERRFRPFFAGGQFFLDKDGRARARTHCGTHDEIIFELQTYGIHLNDQPVRADGSLAVANHQEWVTTRKALELANDGAARTNAEIVIPRRFDVLFGRGKNTREHTGNLRCIHLVEMSRAKYEQANKFEKTYIAERIVAIVYESYGRFLKWDTKVCGFPSEM